jgi:hypothetical protein
MNWETLRPYLFNATIAVLSAIAAGGGTYAATAPTAQKPADPVAALQKTLPQLAIIENMTGLCIKIDRPAQTTAAAR